jgi:hypothetical protein
MLPVAGNRGNPEGMTAARRLPGDEGCTVGAATQPHTAPFPPAHYRIADDRPKDACGAAGAAGSARPWTCLPAHRKGSDRKHGTPRSKLTGHGSALACPDTTRTRKEEGHNTP